VGSPGHVSGILFQNITGTRFPFVPYRGGGPAMLDLVAGQIDLMVASTGDSAEQVRSGKIKAYAITAKSRSTAVPDVPTVDAAVSNDATKALRFGGPSTFGPPASRHEIKSRSASICHAA
jgi:hypothetical protein